MLGYLRVSTEKQVDEGMSLAVQKEKIAAFVQVYADELELAGFEEDAGESGKSLDRPGLTRALDRLASGEVQALIVMKLDRLTRSVRDLGTLIERHFREGRDFLSVSEKIDTQSAAGRLILNVLVSVAQWEREAISERTAASMQHKIKNNEYTGGQAPYGWRRKGTKDNWYIVPNEGEQKILAEVKRLRNEGKTLREIAAAIGVARCGKPLAPMQIARMIERAA